tara:strand:- start:1299 stop:1556 length:258 start_codon:yes stop_codon:yes gene_type:complete
MNAFTAGKERQVYMGTAPHRKSTANKPKQGGKNMITSEQLIEMIEDKMDEVSHILIEDYPKGKYMKGDYMDGYIAALEWMLEVVE